MNIKGQEKIFSSENKDVSDTSLDNFKMLRIENSQYKNGDQSNDFNLTKSNYAENSGGRLSINKRLEYVPTTTPNSSDASPSDRLKAAIDRYLYQAKLHPDSAIVQTNLGKLYHKNQQFTEAIHCYKKAITIDKNYSLAHQYLAQIPQDKVSE